MLIPYPQHSLVLLSPLPQVPWELFLVLDSLSLWFFLELPLSLELISVTGRAFVVGTYSPNGRGNWEIGNFGFYLGRYVGSFTENSEQLNATSTLHVSRMHLPPPQRGNTQSFIHYCIPEKSTFLLIYLQSIVALRAKLESCLIITYAIQNGGGKDKWEERSEI